MPQMTPATARVIDPILTNVARGYANNALIGMSLFPAVPVQQRGGKIVSFGKEAFMTYATGRAPGAMPRPRPWPRAALIGAIATMTR